MSFVFISEYVWFHVFRPVPGLAKVSVDLHLKEKIFLLHSSPLVCCRRGTSEKKDFSNDDEMKLFIQRDYSRSVFCLMYQTTFFRPKFFFFFFFFFLHNTFSASLNHSLGEGFVRLTLVSSLFQMWDLRLSPYPFTISN